MPPTYRDTARRHDRSRDADPSLAKTWPAAAPQTAAHGDVLIRRLHAAARGTCALSSLPGPDQVAFASEREATSHARGYASQAGVDVWEDQGAGHLVRLFRFRADAGSPRRLAALAAPDCAAQHSGDGPQPLPWSL